MLKRTRPTRLSFWEIPITEQFAWTRIWKHGGDGDRAVFAKELPRTVNGFYEYHHPKTEDVCRYYPYRKELFINGRQRPTFTQMLESHYVPPMLNDEQRVEYVAAKSGRSEKDVARELFRMRRLRTALAQAFRDKLTGRWVRQIAGDWTLTERKYFETIHKAAGMFGNDFYNSHSYDPYIIYSPYYQVGDSVDIVLNKTIRTKQQYLFIDICVHNTLPTARLPGVVGKCKPPLQDFEPSIRDLIEMKLSMCAIMARQEGYVTDHAYDPDHDYRGGIVHLFRGSDLDDISFEIIPLELKHELADKTLRHYYDNYMAPFGKSSEGKIGHSPSTYRQ